MNGMGLNTANSGDSVLCLLRFSAQIKAKVCPPSILDATLYTGWHVAKPPD